MAAASVTEQSITARQRDDGIQYATILKCKLPLAWCLEDPAASSTAHFGNRTNALLSAHSSCKANLRGDAIVVSHHPSLPVAFATRLFEELYILRSTPSSQEAGETAILEGFESRRVRRKGVDRHFGGHQRRHILRGKYVRDNAVLRASAGVTKSAVGT